MNELNVSALLKTELQRRISDNRTYSLRAFARSLKMDPSTLAKVIAGQRKLGPKARANLLAKLGMTFDKNTDFFLPVPNDVFEQIPEWYDTGILEQLNVTGFKATKKSLAQVFELKELQIEGALGRLKKLNQIKISKTGIITDITSGQTTNITGPRTSLAKRTLQKQFLEKAIQSLDRDPLEERDMTTITCAVDQNKIAEAKLLIKTFRRQLGEFLSSGKQTSRVYNLSIALYPLTKNSKEIL